jgi:hypothetical protein
MTVLFGRSWKVIRRLPGQYVNGMWTPHTELPAEDILLNIQPASDADYSRTQSILGGRRVTAMMTATADIAAGLHVAGDGDWPGDIIIYNDRRWLVIGSATFDSLIGSITSHMRYLITLEAEHAAAETTG